MNKQQAHIVRLLLSATFCFSSIQLLHSGSIAQPPNRVIDAPSWPLIMLANDEADELILDDFLLAMAQRTQAPVIVSQPILREAFKYASDPDTIKLRKKYPHATMEDLGTTEFGDAFEKYYSSKVRLKAFAFLWQTNNWKFFVPKKNGLKNAFILLVPTSRQKELSKGLQLATLEQFSYQELEKRFEEESPRSTNRSSESPQDIEPFFDVQQKSPSQWIICLIGHGGPRRKIGGFSISWPEAFETFLDFLNKKVYTQALYIKSCYASGDNREAVFTDSTGITRKSPLPFPVILEPVGDVIVEASSAFFDESHRKIIAAVHYDEFAEQIWRGNISYDTIIPPLVSSWHNPLDPKSALADLQRDARENYPQIIQAGANDSHPLFQGIVIGKTAAQYRTEALRPRCTTAFKNQPKKTQQYYIFLKTPYVPFTLNLTDCNEKTAIVPTVMHQNYYVFEHIIIAHTGSENILDIFEHSRDKKRASRGTSISFHIKKLEITGKKQPIILEYIEIRFDEASGIVDGKSGLFTDEYLKTLTGEPFRFLGSRTPEEVAQGVARAQAKFKGMQQDAIERLESSESEKFIKQMGEIHRKPATPRKSVKTKEPKQHLQDKQIEDMQRFSKYIEDDSNNRLIVHYQARYGSYSLNKDDFIAHYAHQTRITPQMLNPSSTEFENYDEESKKILTKFKNTIDSFWDKIEDFRAKKKSSWGNDYYKG